MLKEKYNFYKVDYTNYLILIKSGNFYVCLNNDAIIMNKLFNHKIIETTNLIKTGFPITTLNKIINLLTEKSINYIIVNQEIIEKQKNKKNNYEKYLLSYDIYQVYISRINKISEILKSNLYNSDLNKKLTQIESIL